MNIVIIDSYYPEFLHSIPFHPGNGYEAELRKVLDYQFGTADFYSKNLRALGHDVVDVVSNHEPLQSLWAREHGQSITLNMWNVLQAQIADFAPDVVFLQDLNIDVTPRPGTVIAGQLSCPWPGDYAVMRADLIFSSFPHYVERIQKLGVRAEYLPLAFEPSVLEGPQPERDIDISFVGGVGRDLHWRQGTDTLEMIAETFKERFHWYGYGLDRLSAQSPLRSCYKGTAWGRDMYRIYRRSKIVVNRHGEVAEGYANNMRMYEATGCGALLFTEVSENLNHLFTQNECVEYYDAQHAVDLLNHYLNNKIFTVGTDPSEIARAGQARTLRDHTYRNRMAVISTTLQEMLCPA